MSGVPESGIVLYSYPCELLSQVALNVDIDDDRASSISGVLTFAKIDSPYARKIVWYLALRGIPYALCPQPDRLEDLTAGGRKDLLALGVKYRRIPVLAIGRDVYCDTHIILQKLEARYPKGRLGKSAPEHRLIERLLERWTNDSIFWNVAGTIPPDSPALTNKAWTNDRESMTGRKWSPERQAKGRPEALQHVRDGFNLLEHTVLSDDRDWLLNGAKPSLADIQAIWPFHWAAPMLKDVINAGTHPKTFAWFARFDEALKAATEKPNKVTGDQAKDYILRCDFAEQGGRIDDEDPLKLQGGETVTVFPSDSGFNSKDTGRLVDLTPDEVTIAVRPPSGDASRLVHVHYPRWRFRIVPGASETRL